MKDPVLHRTSLRSICLNISETNKKEVERQQVLPQTEQEVSAVYANKNNPAILPVREHFQTNQTSSRQNENEIKNVVKFEDIPPRHEQQIRDNSSKQDNLSVLDANATPYETTNMHNREAPSLGQDLWRQLKRVEIPMFHGDKRTYQSWKAAFLACIDNAPATPENKLLQLRQYVSGEALQTIESLGHSATAYEAAKERLERKYGGRRRQIAVYLEDLENFKQVRSGNARDLEQLADLLDIAIINLKEAGHFHELGDGSLYNKLQRKLSESISAFRILPLATRVTIGYRRLPMATFGNIWSPSVITSVSCWSPIPPRHEGRGSLGS